MTERRLPRWSELQPYLRTRPFQRSAVDRRLATACVVALMLVMTVPLNLMNALNLRGQTWRFGSLIHAPLRFDGRAK